MLQNQNDNISLKNYIKRYKYKEMILLPAAEYFNVLPTSINSWWLQQQPDLLLFVCNNIEKLLKQKDVMIFSSQENKFMRYNIKLWLKDATEHFGLDKRQIRYKYQIKDLNLMSWLAIYLHNYLKINNKICVPAKEVQNATAC